MLPSAKRSLPHVDFGPFGTFVVRSHSACSHGSPHVPTATPKQPSGIAVVGPSNPADERQVANRVGGARIRLG